VSNAASLTLGQRATSEFVGTALLLATVVGSGIMGELLFPGNAGLALLANSIATGAGLVALILSFQSTSGAHFNPLVSIASAWQGNSSWREACTYAMAQVLGAFVGVSLANVMFGGAAISLSAHERSGVGQYVSEAVATFGLLGVIGHCSRTRPGVVAAAVGAYILAAYWFTASTSFANPAVTLARAFTNSFTGIRLGDVPAFCLFQLVGAIVAVVFTQAMEAKRTKPGTRSVDIHEAERVG
jgi:glycerol uptake facilitator-like aquaporin